MSTFSTFNSTVCNELIIVTFADQSHTIEASQLFYIIGLVSGEVKNGSPFHILSWSSHRSSRTDKSAPAAEILAASEAVGETVIFQNVMSSVLGKKINSMVFFDSKDIFQYPRSLISQTPYAMKLTS